MKKKSKKKKIIIIVISILLLITIMIWNKNNKNKTIEELTTIREVIEYCDCNYISEKKSKDTNYQRDIYVEFKYLPFENDISQQSFYQVLTQAIARVSEYSKIRMVDEKNQITIELEFKNREVEKMLINGEENYFEKQASRNSLANRKNQKEIEVQVQSELLKQLIQNSWDTSHITYGSKESSFNKYDIYFDEGYEIRTIEKKLYNLVFNQNYKNEVIKGIKVGDSKEEIIKELGENYIEEDGILQYETKDFYICFSDDISIYPKIQYDTEKFEKLVKVYKENLDIKTFMNKLTDLWSDYNFYEYDTHYFSIYYTLKGVKVSYSSSDQQGIQIFSNYQGELKEQTEEIQGLTYKLDQSLIIESDVNRKLQTELYGGTDENPLKISNKFYVRASKVGESYNNIQIISTDKEYPNNEFQSDFSISDYIWADDTHLIYNIKKKGIYLYDATTRENYRLIEGTEEYHITDFDRENHILTYDNKQVEIKY